MYRVWGRFGSGGVGEGVSVCVCVWRLCAGSPRGWSTRPVGRWGGEATALGGLASAQYQRTSSGTVSELETGWRAAFSSLDSLLCLTKATGGSETHLSKGLFLQQCTGRSVLLLTAFRSWFTCIYFCFSVNRMDL